jgi:TRAP transporter TAXI family solute receptor
MPMMMAWAVACPFSRRIGILMLCAPAAAIAGAGCRATSERRAPERLKVLARGENPRGLVAYYNETIPGIHSTLEIIPGSAFVVKALKHGSAELGYAQADVVYTAYRSGLGDDPTPYTNLRAIALIQRANVVAVVRRDSRYRRIADLGGARIGIDPEGSYGAVYAQTLLKANGLDEGGVVLAHLSPAQMAARIKEHSIDAAIFVGSIGAGAMNTSLVDLNRTVGIRVLEVNRQTINALRAHYPFITPTTVPAGDIPGEPNEIHTFGVENVLICRRDLGEDLVYRLTAGLFEEAERIAQRTSDGRRINLEQAPATPIPLHPGAARYYREREVLQW